MSEILKTPVTEKSAWTAAELAADPGWTRRLSAGEIDELERVSAELMDRGFRGQDFGLGDFAAPGLKALGDWALEELEHGRGCVLLKGLDVEKYDRARIEVMYWMLGLFLGEISHHSPDGSLIGEVRDQGLDYSDPLVRGYKSNFALYFHCDGLDLVSLLCLRPAMEGGESQIASSMAVFNEILATHPEYLPPLFDGFHFNLRGEGDEGETHPVTRNKVPVFSYFDGRLSCRYLRKAIVEGQKFVGEPLSGLAMEALDYIQELCASDTFRYDMDFEPGDIQILNNYVTLHSRGAFKDWPEPERQRNLLRLWINMRDGRKLEPRFADRYNMGPRRAMRIRQPRDVA